MKNKAILIALIVFTIFLITPFTIKAGGNFYYGSTLVQGMKEYEKVENRDPHADGWFSGHYIGYVAGVYDATSYMYNTNESVKLGQLCAIVAKYLKANPEKWNELASELVVEALKDAFPTINK